MCLIAVFGRFMLVGVGYGVVSNMIMHFMFVLCVNVEVLSHLIHTVLSSSPLFGTSKEKETNKNIYFLHTDTMIFHFDNLACNLWL